MAIILNLPSEIRHESYRHLLPCPAPIWMSFETSLYKSKPGFEAGCRIVRGGHCVRPRLHATILRVNKQIHGEASAILYGSNTLRLDLFKRFMCHGQLECLREDAKPFLSAVDASPAPIADGDAPPEAAPPPESLVCMDALKPTHNRLTVREALQRFSRIDLVVQPELESFVPTPGRRYWNYVPFEHWHVGGEMVRALEAKPAEHQVCVKLRDWQDGRITPEEVQEQGLDVKFWGFNDRGTWQALRKLWERGSLHIATEAADEWSVMVEWKDENGNKVAKRTWEARENWPPKPTRLWIEQIPWDEGGPPPAMGRDTMIDWIEHA